ncbi:hypothetical protein FE257_001522 [Aspergillus nanangensis]|uniref:Uncharacterized protein n=1 Tax=Aspergillus nanangensis TaxID=2582783 RepID=A0AAD4CTI2_ASPNN|nr:hypothetical protein FE257_001522 [Aspergillus nanangensis]
MRNAIPTNDYLLRHNNIDGFLCCDGSPALNSWPHLMIEAAVSQSLPRLQAAAKWWIECSGGAVNAVIIAHINVASKFIQVQKYTPQAPPRDLARQVWETSIDCSAISPIVTQAPLILEFCKVFGRAPQTPIKIP